MNRDTFTIFLGLIAFTALLFWIVSHAASYSVSLRTPAQGWYRVRLRTGGLSFRYHATYGYGGWDCRRHSERITELDWGDVQSGVLRFSAYSALPGRLTVRFPFWLFWLTPGLLILLTQLYRHLRRRRRNNSCRRCGYNLTANVSEVCPECGERKVNKCGATKS